MQASYRLISLRDVEDFARDYLPDGILRPSGEIEATCPLCDSPGLRKRTFSLSTNPQKLGAAICNRQESCGFKGNLTSLKEAMGISEPKMQYNPRPVTRKTSLSVVPDEPKEPYVSPVFHDITESQKCMSILINRGISPEVLQECEVKIVKDKFGPNQHSFFFEACDFMGVPRAGHHRAIHKKAFMAESNGDTRIPWGLKYLEPMANYLLITEGRIDAMSWKTAGIKNVISPSNGFESAKNMVIPKELLESIPDILVAMDEGVSEEWVHKYCLKLRETYPGNIWTINYLYAKDANEMLQSAHGVEGLIKRFEKAKSWDGLSIVTTDQSKFLALKNAKRIKHVDSGHKALCPHGIGTYSVIYGGTGMGKSTLATQSAKEIARSGVPVGYISREMDINKFANRVFYYELGDGTLNIAEEDYAKVLTPFLENMYVNVSRGKISIDALVRNIKQMTIYAENPAQVIFIDNFMMIEQPNDANRFDRVASLLTDLAHKLRTGIVLVAHTSGYRSGAPLFPEGNNYLTRTAYSVTATWRSPESGQHYAQIQKNNNELYDAPMFEDIPFYKTRQR